MDEWFPSALYSAFYVHVCICIIHIYALFSLQIIVASNASFLTKCMLMRSLSTTNIFEVFNWHLNQRKSYGVSFLNWLEPIVILWFSQKKVSYKKVIFVGVHIHVYLQTLSFGLLVAFTQGNNNTKYFVTSWNHCKELRLSEARMNHTYYTHWWIATWSFLGLRMHMVGP
jgi:hypothetical protein